MTKQGKTVALISIHEEIELTYMLDSCIGIKGDQSGPDNDTLGGSSKDKEAPWIKCSAFVKHWLDICQENTQTLLTKGVSSTDGLLSKSPLEFS